MNDIHSSNVWISNQAIDIELAEEFKLIQKIFGDGFKKADEEIDDDSSVIAYTGNADFNTPVIADGFEYPLAQRIGHDYDPHEYETVNVNGTDWEIYMEGKYVEEKLYFVFSIMDS